MNTTYDALGRVHTTERYAQLVVRVFAPDTAEPTLLASELVAASGRLAQSENVYHPAGWLEEVREADGGGAVYRTSHYSYDAAGRIIESHITADGQTQQTRSEYDRTTGRRTSQSVLRDVVQGVEQWQTTRYEYDAAGNVAFTIFDDTSPANQDSFVFTAYDHRGLRISQTDQLPLALRYDGAGRERTADWDAFTTKYHYDAQGRLDRVELPPVDDPQDSSPALVRPTYEYTYDKYGNLTGIHDSLGRVTTQTFDPFGRQLSRTLPDNGDSILRTESWAYLPDGSLDTHTDFKGQTTKTVYDALGRVDAVEYFAAGANPSADPADQTIDYEYNALGRMVSVDETGDVARSTTYGHDSLGRVNEIVTPEGTLVYDYDPATGQLTKIATAHSDVRYDYDHFGRLWHVTALMQDDAALATPQVTTYSYTLGGQVETEELPNGLETVYTYDGLDRLDTKTTTRVSDSTVISSFDYDRRADGRIAHAVETIRNPAGAEETTVIDYVYDQLGRLTRETHDGPTAAEDFTADYLLDLVGNRLQKTTQRGATVETVDYHYNELDQLIEELTKLDGDTQSIYESQYDLNGAQTLRERTDGPLDETTQTYDLRQHLANTTHRVLNGSAQEVVTLSQYGYNHDGLRVRATETTAVDSGTPLVQQTAWLVDASNPTGYGQVWEMFSGSSLSSVIPAALAPTASYVYGHERISQHLPTGDSFYGTDHHGSVKQLWDAAGTVTDTYSYDAFGVPLHTTGTTANPFRYTGEQQDANGDIYLRRRILTPATGVFDSPDPFDGILSSPISLHNHGYGSFDPVNNTDPSGMITLSELGASAAFTTSLGATFGAALGGVLGSATGIGGWRGAYLGTLAGTAIGFGIASHQGTEVLTSAFFDGTISLLTQLAVEGINLNSDTQPPFPGDLHTRLAEAFLTGFSNGAVSAAFTVGLPDSVVTGPLFAAAHSAVNDLVDALRFGAWPDWTELTFDALSQFLFAAVSSPELLFALQRTPGVSKDKVASVLEKLHELGAEKAKAISLAVVGVIWGTVLREVDLVFGNEKTPF